MAADSGHLSILILLNLTAAFDTISHSILLDRLASIGISDTPLDWFHSYPYSIHSVKIILIPYLPPLLWCSPGLCPWPHPIHHLPPPTQSNIP